MTIIPLASALALSWVVLHPGIHEGVVLKAGLILMIFGLLSVARSTYESAAGGSGGFTISVGVLVSCLGAAARMSSWRRGKHS